MPDIREEIRLQPDGVAVYEKHMLVPGKSGKSATERPLDTKRVALDAVVEASANTPLLPPGCRMVSMPGGDITAFVLEESPRVRMVRWARDEEKGKLLTGCARRLVRDDAYKFFGESRGAFEKRLNTQCEFALAFPYIVKIYVFRGLAFDGLYLWFRRKPLVGLDDVLFVPCVTNRSSEAGMCLTDVAKDTHGASFHDMIVRVDRELWGSEWNDDWSKNYWTYARQIPEIASPWAWEWTSRRNSDFVLELPWRGECTLRGALKNIHSSESHLFSRVVARVYAAPEWTPKKKKLVENASPESRALPFVVFADDTGIAPGDFLCVRASVIAHRNTETVAAIEWIYHGPCAGDYLLKLEGISDLLPLVKNNCLVNGVEIRRRMVGASVSAVGGVSIAPGTICSFEAGLCGDDECESPVHVIGERGCETRQNGDIVAYFIGHAVPLIMARNDRLLSGITLRGGETVDENGFLRATTYRCLDGRTLRHGDRFLWDDSDSFLKSYTIAAFYPFDEEEGVRKVRATNGEDFNMENCESLCSEFIPLLAENMPRRARVGSTTVRVGDLMHDEADNKLKTIAALVIDCFEGAERNVYVQNVGEDIWFNVGDEHGLESNLTLFTRSNKRGVRLVGRRGREIGTDRRGRAIHIGDRVRVYQHDGDSEASTPTSRRLLRGRQSCTVVHAVREDFDSTMWLYLDLGRDVGQVPRPDAVGFEEIPERLRFDASWWSRLVWAERDGCEVISRKSASCVVRSKRRR